MRKQLPTLRKRTPELKDMRLVSTMTWNTTRRMLNSAIYPDNCNGTQSAIGRALWLPDGSGLLAVIRAQERGQLWYVSYPRGEAKRVTNDLTDYALDALDLTRDGKSLVTVENTIISNLWVVARGDASNARQITSGKTAARAFLRVRRGQ